MNAYELKHNETYDTKGTPVMRTELRWYIISTQGLGSRAVVKIQDLLTSIGYSGKVWVPAIKALPTTTSIKKAKANGTTIFPGYVFLETTIDEETGNKLEQALIEAKLGKFLKLPHDEEHDLPTVISKEEIEYIETLQESNVEPVPEEIVDIELGNLVEICVGPLIGFKGIVVKISGHSASIDTLIFGRSTPVSVNIAHLTKLSDSNEEKAN